MNLGDLIIGLCDGAFGTIEKARRWCSRAPVQTISTAELQSLMSFNGPTPVLVDVRSDAEQAVSRIPGAITKQAYEATAGSHAGEQVVVYCTIGGRSYLYARKLVAAGVDATNYREGILGWCRAELPLENPDSQATLAVHPYWRVFRVPHRYTVKKSSSVGMASRCYAKISRIKWPSTLVKRR